MADKLRLVFRLWRLQAWMDYQWFTQDRLGCLLCVFSDTLGSISSIGGILLLSARFEGVGGWSFDEILWMLGFFTLADGLTYMLFGGYNVLNISRRVGRGQVDHMLIQPVPLWMQLLTGGFMPLSGNSPFIVGLALTICAGVRLRLAVTPGFVLLLCVCLLARMAIALALSYIAGAAAFYRPAACEELSSLVLDTLNALGKYPLPSIPDWALYGLCTLVPIAPMAYMPCLVLLGKTGTLGAYLSAATGAALCALAAHLFRKGLKHYALNGVGRYRGLGHRG